MEADRFDRFARALDEGMSRRGILGIASAGLGAFAALTGLDFGFGLDRALEAEAKNKKKKRKKRKKKCNRNPDTQWCGGKCRDILNDANNCGACGTVCQSPETCQNGSCTCTPDCPDSACGQPDGCGGICDICPPGAVPICAPEAGICVCAVQGPCCLDTDCPQGERCIIQGNPPETACVNF